jgi:hypothetical protein
VVGRRRLSSRFEGASSEASDATGSRTRARKAADLSLSDRISDQDTMCSGEPEDRSWWMPGRSRIGFFGTRSSAGLEIPDRPEGLGLVEFGFSGREG